MWKFVLGPVLMGIGYIVGSIYGESVEQIVHKRPATRLFRHVPDALGPCRRRDDALR